MNLVPLFGLARLAYSGGLILAPQRLAAPWLGDDQAGDSATKIALRGLAARDAALALGVVIAPLTRRSPRVWLLLCALGDAADIAATLAAPPDDLPASARIGTIALAGSSALVGLGLASKARSR
ncbi:MAG: hypothetical protein QOF77_151 [Solirubrobacteraceae bacterium]|jgi:hypothetical protein|nr:hypothetical protein [Solirubrobacteraceae bacterium]